VPSTRPTRSTTAATCTSAWVSTPPVTGPAGSAILSMTSPSPSCRYLVAGKGTTPPARGVRTKHFRDTEGQAPTWSRTPPAGQHGGALPPAPARRFGGKTRDARSVRRRAKTGTGGRTRPAWAKVAVDHQRRNLVDIRQLEPRSNQPWRKCSARPAVLRGALRQACRSAGTARPGRSRRASTTSAAVCPVRGDGLSKQCLGTCAVRPSYGSRTTDSYISEFWLVPTALPQLRTTRLGPKADSPKVSPGQSLTLPN
jgi:hypothetical protein